MTVDRQVEQVARASYGRLLALLAAPTGDIPLAEDALADAFEQALRTWPVSGVPANPEGWLLTVARNRIRDVFRSASQRTSTPLGDLDPAVFDNIDLDAIPDKRLELMFVATPGEWHTGNVSESYSPQTSEPPSEIRHLVDYASAGASLLLLERL